MCLCQPLVGSCTNESGNMEGACRLDRLVRTLIYLAYDGLELEIAFMPEGLTPGCRTTDWANLKKGRINKLVRKIIEHKAYETITFVLTR